MKKYLRYVKRILRLSWLKLKSYPQDFSITVLIIPCFMAVEMGTIFLILSAGSTKALGGYTIFEILFVLISSRVINEIATFCTLTSARIPYQIVKGELDSFLYKPLSSFITIGIQQIYIKKFLGISYNILAIIAVLYLGAIHLDSTMILLGTVVLLESCCIYFCLATSAGALSFYFEGLMDVQDFVFETRAEISHYPSMIFPRPFRFFFTFVFPIFLVATPLFQVLRNEYTVEDFIIGLSVTGICILFTTALWSMGLKRYSSAN